MDEGKVHLKEISHGRASATLMQNAYSIPLGSPSIGRDEDGLAIVGDPSSDVLKEDRLGTEIVHGNGKESLDLGCMQVHGDQMIRTGSANQIGHKFGRYRSPRPVLLVLAGVGKVWND